MKRSTHLVVMTLLVFSMVLFPSGSKSQITPQARPEIKIGALGPLAITPGTDMQSGAQMAVEEINAGAGVDVGGTAYNFKLVTRSTSDPSTGIPDPTTAYTNLQTLVQTDQVVAVLGGFRTEVVLGAVEPLINTTHTPFLGVGSTAPLITPYFYRVGPVNGSTLTRNILGMYSYLHNGPLKINSTVVVREDQAWTYAITDALVTYLPAFGLTVDNTTVSAIPVDASAADVATALNTLTGTPQADAIISLFSAPVGKLFTEQWTATGLNDNYLLAGINVESQRGTFYTETEGAAAGEMELESAPPGVYPTNTSKTFVDAYQAEFNKYPTYTSFASYDAVYIIKDAIERAAAFDSASIHAMLPSTDYAGVAAEYKFTSESSAGQVASIAVPQSYKIYNNAIVHDLYTTSTYSAVGTPYAQPYFAQWLENGTKIAVYSGPGTSSLYANVTAPPYAGVYNPPTTSVPSSGTSSGTGTTTTTSTPPPQETSDTGGGSFLPGFEATMVMLVLFSGVFVQSIRRKKSKI